MHKTTNRTHIQTFRCGSPSHRNSVIGKLYPTEHGYTLSLSGAGTATAPKTMFHDPWGRHTDKITHLEIGEGITEIGSNAFSTLYNLISVQLPSTLTAIYSEAFSGCQRLKNVHLPDRLEYIGPAAFYRCIRLTSVSFGTDLQSIETEAFRGCLQMEQAILPNRVRKIGESAFENCTALSELILPTKLKRIAPNTFKQCNSLPKVSIPAGVQTIDDQAFAKCGSLRLLDLRHAENLTSIHDSAFMYCLALEEIHINSVQRTFATHHFPVHSSRIKMYPSTFS